MKNYSLTKLGEKKFKSQILPLYSKDFDFELRPTPGEWGVFHTTKGKFWGFVNIVAESTRPQAWILSIFDSQMGVTSPEDYIRDILKHALDKRKLWKTLQEGARLFFGSVDGLPGLVIDQYDNCIIIQIETAGVDIHRELIKSILEHSYEQPCYFWDKKSRLKEGLPLYCESLELAHPENKNEKDAPEIIIKDSGFTFNMSTGLAQKSGYYYDHRKNRQKFETLISEFQGPKNLGLDLFSYLGSWGMHQLRAGVRSVDFIDQANFSDIYEQNLKLNGFSDRAHFHRASVFDFLKGKRDNNESYDVISCDPPAFAKSKERKKEAIRGYQKLHGLVFDIASRNSLIAFASCTQYVSLEEFETTIREAAWQKKRSIQLVDMGLQAWDHPLPHFKSSSNYIKYLAYTVE